MGNSTELKSKIKEFCIDAGADIVGFAPVERWDEYDYVEPEFRPKGVWAPARTVIVMGVGMPLPVVETTPSYLHKETYDIVNRILDKLAFDLVRWLNRKGHASFYFTRDGFASLRLLLDRPKVPFSHIPAAFYAGLGTIGMNQCLLTPEFGPRVRFVSVFTSIDLPADPVIEKDLCIKCDACVKCCPVDALKRREDRVLGDYDMVACLKKHEELNGYKTPPCGICTKVCPIGNDRILYEQTGSMKKYLDEEKSLAVDPNDPKYKTWNHIRKYGAWNKDYPRN